MREGHQHGDFGHIRSGLLWGKFEASWAGPRRLQAAEARATPRRENQDERYGKEARSLNYAKDHTIDKSPRGCRSGDLEGMSNYWPRLIE
jgi:hypothetical protein